MALHGLGDLAKAYTAYEDGLKLEPGNAQIKSGLQAVSRELENDAMQGGMP